jgi:hypothetical protein
MSDTNRIEFLEKHYFSTILYDKNIHLWKIFNNKSLYPFACDYNLRGTIDRCFLNRKDIISSSINEKWESGYSRNEGWDKLILNFLEQKLFNLIEWSEERHLWYIKDYDTDISISSDLSLRKCVNKLLGIR